MKVGNHKGHKMRILYAEDNSFFLMKIFEDRPISKAVEIISMKENTKSEKFEEFDNEIVDQKEIKNDEKTSTSESIQPYQQVFIFNNSFKLDQVILAMKNEICATIGQNANEEKVISILQRIEKLLDKNNVFENEKIDKYKLGIEFKILLNELTTLINQSTIFTKNTSKKEIEI